MATLVGEAKQFMEPRVVVDLGVTALGLYATHLVANKIPFGAKTGWTQAGKLALTTAGLSFATSKVRPQWAEAVFTGGGLLTVFEVVGILSHGMYGLANAADMPAANGGAGALPGTGPATQGSPKALPSANPNVNALNKSPNAVALADASYAAM